MKLPDGVPPNGVLKLQIRNGRGVGSMRKTNLHQLPPAHNNPNGPPDTDYYDFVYEFRAADIGLTSVRFFLSDAAGNPLLTQPMQALDMGGGSWWSTSTFPIPAGTAGQTLTLVVSTVCNTVPEQYAHDSVSVEVIAAVPPPATLTLDAPYGTQLTEGVATKFRCRLAPLQILPKVQAFSYTFNIPSLEFSQTVGLDPALFVPVNAALECEFGVVIPVGTVPGAPAVGTLSVRVTADGIVYGANFVNITVNPSAQVQRPHLDVI